MFDRILLQTLDSIVSETRFITEEWCFLILRAVRWPWHKPRDQLSADIDTGRRSCPVAGDGFGAYPGPVFAQRL